MMITLQDIVDDAALFLELGETVRIDTDSGPVQTLALVGVREDEAPSGTVRAWQSVTIRSAAAAVKAGDAITIRGRSTRVASVVDDGAGLLELLCWVGDEA